MDISDIVSDPKKKSYEKYPEMVINQSKKYTATIHTNHGDIEIELFANTAPKTVNNFVFLAKSGFYDGTIFHRVIPEFVIQGGDPYGNGMGGPGYKFEDEFNEPLPPMTEGTLAMANAGPGTNGSQFFICLSDLPYLQRKHTPFGKVTKGMDVCINIASSETDMMDKPEKDVIISSIDIVEV